MPLASLILLSAVQTSAVNDFDPGPNPLLMQNPTASKTNIVFEFADDLWIVPRTGGPATRLTTAPGKESNPRFSPDGTQVAFSGQYDGNRDAYVIPTEGGVPARLTAHPGADLVMGWTADGKNVLIQSNLLSNTDYTRMFQVPATGGVPKPLPVPAVDHGSLNAAGTHLAYIANGKWQQAWKRYRGGQAGTIWIARLSDSKWVPVPKNNTDDRNPLWFGDDLYYLSDPTGPVGMNRYDVKSGKTSVVIPGRGFDLKSASAGPDVIVYEKLGGIYLFDPKTKESTRVPITLRGDLPEVRPAFKDVSDAISSVAISPSGNRLVVSARGYIFTIPASKGDARLVDGTQGLNRHDASWSPDGKTLAYITDAGGSQKLALYDLATSKEKTVSLAVTNGYYRDLRWSHDSKKLTYQAQTLGLYVLDVATGKSLLIDKQTYRGRGQMTANWSPDSKWIAYSRDLTNSLNAVFLYNVDTTKATQITDNLADATSPTFDRDGKHLYMLVSTDIGSSSSFENMSAYVVPNSTSKPYVLTLRKDLPNPLQPESDEEAIKKDEKEAAKPDAAKPDATKPDPAKTDAAKAEPASVIDLNGIAKRAVPLPLPRAGYQTLVAGPAGSVFVLAMPPRATSVDNGGPGSVTKFAFADRKPMPFASGVMDISTNADGSKILLAGMGGLQLVSTMAPAPPGEGTVNTDGLKVKIDPRAEWRAMYHEVWRNQRMLFYDANLHGMDSAMMEKRYEPFLANIMSRSDLNYLWTDMLGELCVGHMFIGGGDIPGAKSIPGGLLGADYSFENGRYRLTRIYDGESWNPGLDAPLAKPGVAAKVGEYILAIDGQELTELNDIYIQLEGKAGKQVRLKIGPTVDGVGSREVVTVPVADEFGLRFRSWTEDNRRRVDEATGGRVGYVHVPDTGTGGWREFQRFYYAQGQKDAIIVDDRFNHGGSVNDFMVWEMQKPWDFMDIARYGEILRDPVNHVYGPKVMLVNEMAGSGGDIFPYIFKKHKVGKVIGRRTWGAMISAYGFPVIDGGSVRAPDDAMADPDTGDWIIENYGTAPDITVEFDPFIWRQGKDAQLEAGIKQILEDLKSYKPKPVVRPPYPNWSKVKTGGR